MEIGSETRVGWDSNLCIEYLDKDSIHLDELKKIIDLAVSKKITIWCSDLAIIESCKLKTIDEKLQTKTVVNFFEEDYIESVTINRKVAIEAHKIRRMNIACPYDSIHLATCVIMNIHIFLTHDGMNTTKKFPLLPQDKKLKTIDGQKLRIITPRQYFEEIENEQREKERQKDLSKGQERFDM